MRALVACVLSVLATGCVASTPAPAPPVSVPPQWTAGPAAAGGELAGGAYDAAAAWWSQFGSEQLDDLVAEALAANHDLAAAAARVAAADARARAVGADRLPQVSVGFDGVRAKRNFIGFPIPGAEDVVLSTSSTNLALHGDVSWDADLWGRLRARERGALAEIEVAVADRRAAELAITGRVVGGWLALIEAGQQVDLLGRTLDSRRNSRTRVEARYRRGLAPALDLRLARSEEALAESAVEAMERRRGDLARGLEVLLGRYPDAAVTAPPALPATLPPVPAALPAQVVVRRPDLAAAERRLAAAGARVDEARRALYPRLVLTGSGGTATRELTDLVDGDFSVWSLSAGLLQPLFQGGRLRAAIEFERASRDALLAEYARQTLDAFAEVESALDAESRLGVQVEALERAARESAAAEALASDRYANGLESYLFVLEAQRRSFGSEALLLERRRDRLAARVDLILALGGGFEHHSVSPDAAGASAGE